MNPIFTHQNQAARSANRFAITCISALLTVPAFAIPQSNDAGVTVVDAEIVDETMRPANPNAKSRTAPGHRIDPADLVGAIPMQLPEVTEHADGSAAPPMLVEYDLRSRSETILGEMPPSDEIIGLYASWDFEEGGPAGGGYGSGDETQNGPTTQAAWDLSRIDNPEQFPWSVNGKLYMKFPNGRWYSGSAILIDSRHVLTSARNTYNAGLGGWVEESVFFPAHGPSDAAPFGGARGVTALSWPRTEYRTDSDYNWDMAIIRLDRPVGALAGWHAYGYNSDDSWWYDAHWYNLSYPGGSDGYDGSTMYYRSGQFVSVFEHQAHFYGTEYGGQLGSGVYAFVNGTRYVQGVHSHAHHDWGSTVGVTRMTATKFNAIRQRISEYTPDEVDFIPLDVNAPADITQGERLDHFNYLVHNYSTERYQGPCTVDVYLSTDEFITEDDTFIQRHNVNVSLNAKGSARVDLSTTPLIPDSIPAGQYYIGVIVRANDADTSNNATGEVDVSEIVIYPRSDRAEIERYRIKRGELISGDLDSLRESDDNRLRFRADYRPRKARPYEAQMQVVFRTDYLYGQELYVGIESRIDDAGGVGKVFLKNWDTGRWDHVLEFAVPTTEELRDTLGIAADAYVAPDGLIKAKITYSTLTTSDGDPFKCFFDMTVITVQ